MRTGVARIGVLGGTFDPVHHGHLDAARAARRALGLTDVVLMPSPGAPHRACPPTASGYHRFAMAALASCPEAGLRVSDLELRAPDPPYTSRTLQRLAQRGYVPSRIFFIVGSDAFADIGHWYDYPALLHRSHFAVVARAGDALDTLRRRLPALADRMRDADGRPVGGAPDGTTAIWLVHAETRDISSSGIRRRLAAAAPMHGLLPEPVAEHIARHRLYAPATSGELLA